MTYKLSKTHRRLSRVERATVAAACSPTTVATRLSALVAVLAFTLPFTASAHDIPNDVTIQAFVKPDGQHLYVLVRAPLRAMLDVDYPRHGEGYLDIAHADDSLRDAATLYISDNIDIFEGDARLQTPVVARTRVSLESDRSFESYEGAVGNLMGPRLENDTNIYWQQGLLDVLFDYAIQSDQSRFSIQPRLGRLGLRVVTVLRFVPPGGSVRAFEFSGEPGIVRLDPRWHQAAFRFVEAGFWHILSGTDHLLFLFCLVIPFRRPGPLIGVVTAFTLAHSITLIASAYNVGPDGLWFPPLIETLIAASIVYMALENIVGGRVQRRWIIAFGFGLVHGFGFSFALRETLQFAGSHLLTSLLSFNVGVELGQLLVLLLLVPALSLLFRFVVAERIGTIILSALIAHTAWHWMIERGENLRQFGLPTPNAANLAIAMRWMMLLMLVAALLWLAQQVIRRRATNRSYVPEKTDVANTTVAAIREPERPVSKD